MGLLALILVVMVGLGIMFSLPSLFGEAGAGIGEAFTMLVEKTFILLALALPILTVFAFFYIGVQKEKTEVLLFSAVYGILVYLLLKFTGVYDVVSQYFYGSYLLYTASLMDYFMEAKNIIVGTAMFVIGAITNAIDKITTKFFEGRFSSWIKRKRRK